MDTNRLRQFCVAFETSNLRKAAEILRISHSALSKSLKVLQAEIAGELFVQVGRNIVATEFGKGFYPKAKAFLDSEADLLRKEGVAKAPFRIGTFEVFSTYCLGSLYRKYFGEAALELHELLPGSLESALVSGKVDVGLTYEPIPLAGAEFVKIGCVEMGVYKRKDSFRSVKFVDLPFVAPLYPIDGTPSGTKGLDGWPENRIARNVQYRVDMMESGLAMARDGLAAIFIPQFVARLHNETIHPEHRLVHVPTPNVVVKRDVYLVTRNNSVDDERSRRLAKLIRMECISK